MRSRLGPAVALAATLLALIPSAASATGGAIAGVPQTDAGALAASDRHTCVLTASGKVRCAGDNGAGQLGDGGSAIIGNDPGESTSIGAITSVKTLGKAGTSHQCAIRDDGGLWCWGTNSFGELGIGTTGAPAPTPVQVDLGPGRTAKQVAGGTFNTCAIRDDGALRCWGYNGYGQLGDGTATSQALPTVVSLPGGAAAEQITAGDGHTCAVLSTVIPGSLWCWGYNGYGELGVGSTTNSYTPVGVNFGAGVTVKAIAAGQIHTCAITSTDQVRCFGYNAQGQLGDTTNTNRTAPSGPVNLGAGRTAVAITAGAAFTCALLDNGEISCWGSGTSGQFGTGAATTSNTPVSVPLGGRKALAISAGWSHLCAMFDDRTTRCWGDNSYGKLAQGSVVPYGGNSGESPLGLPAIGLGGELAGRDTDADGVRDAVDACLTTAGTLANGCPAPVTPPSGGGGGGGGGTTPTPTVKPELALSGRTLTFNALLKRAKKAKSCPKSAVATTGTGSSKRTKSLKSTTETVAGKVRCRITGTLTLKRKPKSGVTVRVKLTSPKLTTRTLSVKAP